MNKLHGFDKARLGWTLIVIAGLLLTSFVAYDVWFYHYLVNVNISTTGICGKLFYVLEFDDRTELHHDVFSTHFFRALSTVKKYY